MYEHYRTGLTKLGFMNAETNFTIKILALQVYSTSMLCATVFHQKGSWRGRQKVSA